LVATLLSLALCELIVRVLPADVLGFEYSDGYFTRVLEFEPRRDRKSLGSPDVRPGPRAAGTIRVLLLGDSMVAAVEVAIEQSVGRRLQWHLDATSPGRYDVVAIGLYGRGQIDELKALRRRGKRLAPDAVITVFYAENDPINNDRDLHEAAATQVREMTDGWATQRIPESRMRGLMIPASALNRLLSHRLTVAAIRRESPILPLAYLAYSPEPGSLYEQALHTTEALILKTRDAARRLGADYALVSAPSREVVLGDRGLEELLSSTPRMRGREWNLDLPDQRLAAFASEHDIPFLALAPSLREAATDGPAVYWKMDPHWTPRGHDLAARQIAEFIREELRAGSH
jgi:hypothetical protein